MVSKAKTSEGEKFSHLLIVEDDLEQLRTLTDIMVDEGFNVIGCASATEAMQHLRSQDFGVAIVDLRLPDHNGEQLLERIRSLSCRTRVIIHTGYGSFESAKVAVNLGAFAYVEKLSDPDELLRHVYRAFREESRSYAEALEAAVAERTRELVDANDRLRREISERKQAEEELQRLATAVEQSSDGIAVADMDGIIQFVNKSWAEMHNYSIDEVIGKHLSIFHIEEHLQQQVIPAIDQLKKTGVYQGEIEHVRKDHTTFPTWMTGALMRDEEGNAIGMIGIAHDITERKRAEEVLRQSEEKYRTLFEESKDAVFISTPEGKFLDMNPAGVELFGYASKEELLQADIAEDLYFNPKDREAFQKTVQENGFVKDYELVLKKKDGQELFVLETATIVRDEHSKIIGYRGIIHDMTERKKLEDQLQHAQKMETVGTLASGVAHDFNNILQAIHGYVDMCLDEVPPKSQVHDDLQEVMGATTRAKNIVQQMLAFSRHDDQERRPLRLHLIVREALNLLKASVPSTIKIRQKINKNCGPIIANTGQMHQVVMNLCTNAYQAMSEDKGILSVSLEMADAKDTFLKAHPRLVEKRYVRLSVNDTGEGIDQATMKRIFEPFFTTKDIGKGTGLGLSVVHGIVTAHQGDISVESEPGKGATFRVYLPVIEEAAEQAREKGEKTPGGHERILLLDDEKVIASVAKRLLERLGYKVTMRNGSVETLKAFRANPDKFDLVITDQTMPEMTGVELAEELLNIRPELPIILMSGLGEGITQEAALANGFREFVMKPFTVSELGKAIRRAMTSKTGIGGKR